MLLERGGVLLELERPCIIHRHITREGGLQSMDKIRGFEIAEGWEGKAKLPVRSTKYSAGYDLAAAEDTVIPSVWQQLKDFIADSLLGRGYSDDKMEVFKPTLVPTGVKAYMPDDEYLFVCNRSSGPIKRRLILGNGAGIVDKDYYGNKATNITRDGNILVQFYNFGVFPLRIKAGESIAQAVFHKYLLADGDQASGIRDGGFGSTTEVKS